MLFLAIRYLLSRPRQTLLTLLGIFFGTAAYITISGFMLGFREYLIDQLINTSPHIYIEVREVFYQEHELDLAFFPKAQKDNTSLVWLTPPSGGNTSQMLENPEGWYQLLKSDERVQAFSPQLSVPVVFSNGKSNTSATLTGCNPTEQVRVTNIGDDMVQGDFSDLSAGGNRLVIGEELRKKLGLQLSQNVMVSLAEKPAMPFKVVGVFNTGNKMTDNKAYAELRDVQTVSGTLNVVNEIAVKLKDHTLAKKLSETWSQVTADTVESWDQRNSSLFDVFKIQDAVRYLSIGAILVVASFGIYNILNMTVMQKKKDIAILHSLGYQPKDIVFLFFSQGLVVGVIGTILGVIVGYVFCRYLATLPFSGEPMGSGSGFMMVSFNPKIYWQATTLGILTSTIASILPARAAGKFTPIEIIRSGVE